jgi:thiol-disulfide isomerase/thioredoxin
MSTITQLDKNLDSELQELDKNIPILKISDFNNDTSLKKFNDGITLILFYMTGCGHCERFKPALNRVFKNANKIFKNIPIHIVASDITTKDGSQIQDLINKYGNNFIIRGVPKVVGYKNGEFYAVYAKGNDNYRKPSDVLAFISGLIKGVPVEKDNKAAS